MALKQLNKADEGDQRLPSQTQETRKKKGLFGSLGGSAKEIAKNTVKELFDVCIDSATEKSTNVIETYEAKTQEFATQLIHSEKEIVDQVDKRLQHIIHLVFKNLDATTNIITARILSVMTTVSLLYVAFQLCESIHVEKISMLRVSITFFLLTVLIAACLRIVRFAFDWRESLKEFQRWQFITGLVTGCGIVAGFITGFVIQYI